MDWFVKRFLQAALVWLGLGVTLGVAMSVYPFFVIYRPAHMHMNLLGFVAMMIFGVGYHVIPRFFGQKLRYRGLAGAHWWIFPRSSAFKRTVRLKGRAHDANMEMAKGRFG